MFGNCTLVTNRREGNQVLLRQDAPRTRPNGRGFGFDLGALSLTEPS